MNVAGLAERVTAGLEPPVSEVCDILIRRFATTPADQQHRMSYKLLADFAHRDWRDEVFQSALNALVSAPDRPLVLYFLFLDTAADRELPVELSEFKQSVKEHVFVHPRTGEEIVDFEHLLIPVFRLNQQFARLLSAAR